MGIPSTPVLKLVSKEYHFNVFFEVDEPQRSVLYDLSQYILGKGKQWNIFQTFCQDCMSLYVYIRSLKNAVCKLGDRYVVDQTLGYLGPYWSKSVWSRLIIDPLLFHQKTPNHVFLST